MQLMDPNFKVFLEAAEIEVKNNPTSDRKSNKYPEKNLDTHRAQDNPQYRRVGLRMWTVQGQPTGYSSVVYSSL